MLKRVEDIAGGYRHALCQFELSDQLIACDMSAAERCTFEACLQCRQAFVSDNRAGKPLDVELFDKRAAKRHCVCDST